ncbi:MULTISPECIES: ArpU family phage packaging/lysis transcriptional regulator [Bacillus]|uniref:ArpU family phage packaging/lysis transcriptional regulator n=1 Tax=Bacillus TaxID=1386 RepID=UPI000BFA642B|nr:MULTISPECIES: ArpU family phage packaging/lysis transcriptional regulator [Bacillus]AYF06473.1 ArpU family transcriptional regulator [Bacillus mobilis]PEU79650.1 ArpU family transcriptional regulator [Bacillus cereus]PGT50564.1 ArpU family transcriptional regulator [Bacillus cereus]PGV91594.1 ArpU family transcriptional regulator [Bacillus cereus]BCD29310.1 ArpU family transcriptional regulator [Bacillus cereus]
MNQLSFFEDIDEKEMRRLVVKELKNYKALCVRMKNQEEQAQAGGIVFFPKMKGDDKNHEIRFKQIERTLKHALDNDQRQIIELKYLGNEKVKDSYVYNELMMRRDNFYENKKSAIWLIAMALGII